MLFWTHQLWDLTWRFVWTGDYSTSSNCARRCLSWPCSRLLPSEGFQSDILSMTKINYAWTHYYILCKVLPKYYRWESLIFVWFLIFQILFTLMRHIRTAVNNTIMWWIPLKWLDSYWISSCSPRQAIEWVSSNIFQTAKSHSKIKNNRNICIFRFKTIAGREFCVDPEDSWVNRYVAEMNSISTVSSIHPLFLKCIGHF